MAINHHSIGKRTNGNLAVSLEWQLGQVLLTTVPAGQAYQLLALAEITDLMAREKAQDAIRFEWLQTRTEFDFFSAEMVFAYYLEAVMLHRWSILTVEEGEKVFRELVADMKKGVSL